MMIRIFGHSKISWKRLSNRYQLVSCQGSAVLNKNAMRRQQRGTDEHPRHSNLSP